MVEVKEGRRVSEWWNLSVCGRKGSSVINDLSEIASFETVFVGKSAPHRDTAPVQ